MFESSSVSILLEQLKSPGYVRCSPFIWLPDNGLCAGHFHIFIHFLILLHQFSLLHLLSCHRYLFQNGRWNTTEILFKCQLDIFGSYLFSSIQITRVIFRTCIYSWSLVECICIQQITLGVYINYRLLFYAIWGAKWKILPQDVLK